MVFTQNPTLRSKFYEDKRRERLFGQWLDKYFYNYIKNGCTELGIIKEFKRVENEIMQKKGVDIIAIDNAGKEIYIDEKASLHYINKNLPTFAFELRNRTSGKQGWLFNPYYITDYYLLCWPNADDEAVFDEESFSSSEVMLIGRKKLLEFLLDKGLTEQKIYGKILSYEKDARPGNNTFLLEPGLKLNFNFTLREQPVNLVIWKNQLKKCASYYAIIRK